MQPSVPGTVADISGACNIDMSGFGYASTPSTVQSATGTSYTKGDGSANWPQLMPTSAILPYAGDSGTVPPGWLMCDGSSKVRTDYPDLFATIGTAYGSVDSTHFNVPDLRSRFPIGAGTFAALADSDGVSEASRTPRHTHSISGQANAAANTAATGGGQNVVAPGSYNGHAHGGDTGQNGRNTIPFVSVNYIIKI